MKIDPLESRIASAVVFVVETSTKKLFSVDSATPDTLLIDPPIAGLKGGEFVAAINFRPATGEF